VSYADLVQRDDVDAVYVANQPNDHRNAALLAIEAGKHVLIEKPVTHSVIEAGNLMTRARQAKSLSMEAMWTRYLPQTDIARQLVEAGAIGSPQLIVSDFCHDNSKMERMWRKGQGGPMRDMSIYPIALCQLFPGEPSSINAHGILHENKMDAEITAYLSYPGGARATFTVSGIVDAPHHAFVAGDEGVIEFGPPFVLPSCIGLSGNGFDAPMQVWRDDSNVRGHAALAYQVTAFADYVSRGLVESPLQSHDDTLVCLRTAAEILRCVGADAP
jgi:predicted dehydrogenase